MDIGFINKNARKNVSLCYEKQNICCAISTVAKIIILSDALQEVSDQDISGKRFIVTFREKILFIPVRWCKDPQILTKHLTTNNIWK